MTVRHDPVAPRAAAASARSTSPTSAASRSVGRRVGAAPERALRAHRAPPAPGVDAARGRGCARARAAGGPDARPSIETSARLAELARPRRPWRCRGRAACRRSPARRPTGARRAAGAGTPSSPSGGTTSSPSGLATPLATLARNFVRATPTVIGRPTCSRTLARAAARRSRRGVPAIRSQAARRRGTPRRSRAPRRAAWCRRTPRTPPARLGVGRHPRRHDDRVAGTAAAPARRPSRCARRSALAS